MGILGCQRHCPFHPLLMMALSLPCCCPVLGLVLGLNYGLVVKEIFTSALQLSEFSHTFYFLLFYPLLFSLFLLFAR